MLGGALVVGLTLYLFFIVFTIPNVDDIGALFAAESTVITDRNGVELYRIHGDEDRTFVPLESIAPPLRQATIAIEDERFYGRGCFDPRAFLRAAAGNVFGGFGSQGGSTITQQFAKNALIGTRQKRITRKLKEYILSCKLEHRYSKDQILEMYLNRIPYGHNVHGAEQAARTYFAKSASGLTLAEAAILAALPQLPSYYNPYGQHARSMLSEAGQERLRQGAIHDASDLRDRDFWIGLIGETIDPSTGIPLRSGTGGSLDGIYIGGRTDQVLKNMEAQGFIGEEQRLQALTELQTLTFQRARENIRAPHFVLAVREEVEQMFHDKFQEGFLEEGGLHIVTTLDWTLQNEAEKIVQEVGQMNENLYGAHNAALLAANVDTGEVIAYVGNRDYWDTASDGNVDIVRSPRQPGSSFKPFVYATAFLHGVSPATVLYDVPINIYKDEPDNFDLTFWGPLTIRRAIGASRNIPAAQAFFLAGGEEAILSLTEQMGLSSLRKRKEELAKLSGKPYEYGWPLALGAAEVPLREMVRGYLTFAREGKAIDFTTILRIEDRNGNILYQAPTSAPFNGATAGRPLQGKDVLDPRVAYFITSMLSDISVRPSEYWRTQLSVPGYQTAAKTGTSNKCLKRAPVASDETEGKCLELRADNNWTLGYTPEIVAGVWVGNASGGVMQPKASGLDTASHIWRPFMIAAHKTLVSPRTTFAVPDGIESTEISELSGKLAAPCTPVAYRRAELFLQGQTPKEFDDACTELEVDALTGLLPSDECPRDALEKRSFFRPQSVFKESRPEFEEAVERWARELAAGTGSIFRTPSGALRGTGAFLPLPLPLVPTEKCRLALTPGRLTQPTLRIIFPDAAASASYPIFAPKISYTVGDTVREVRYELDGKLIARVESGSDLSPNVRLTRRFDPSGTHTLKVTLTDSYLHTVEDSVRFTFEGGEEGTPVRRQGRETGASISSPDE